MPLLRNWRKKPVTKNSEKRVPALRFKGFTNDWEQRKFENLVSRLSKTSNNESLPNVTYDDIKSRENFLNKDITKLTHGKKGIHFNKDDILFGKLRPYLGNILLARFNGIAVGDFWVLSPKDNNISSFLFDLIQTSKYKYISNLSSGSKMPRSDWNLVSKASFWVPIQQEQNKIGKIFQLIDNLVSLQQRKLKDIQLLKKAYLKAIFKSNKSTYKLKDIADYRRGSFPQPYGNPKWYGGDGSLPFVQVIDVAKNLRLYNSTKQRISRLAQSKSVFVPKGSILITLQGSIGKVAITQYDAFVDRTLLIISNLKKDVDKYYFAYALQDKFNEEKRKAPGGTIKTITKNALSEFQIKLPKKDIQKKQSSILQKIDKDIYIINLKLSELSKFKQFLLQNMFI